MKITIYELLGLIKDGKAPKKIQAYVYNWVYDNNNDYINDFETKLFEDFLENVIANSLNDEIEVIEEKKNNFSGIKYFSDGECVMSIANEPLIKDEFIDIEEFKEHQIFDTKDILELQMFINKRNAEYDCKINDLIKNQKKIIDKLHEVNK